MDWDSEGQGNHGLKLSATSKQASLTLVERMEAACDTSWASNSGDAPFARPGAGHSAPLLAYTITDSQYG